MSGGRFLYNCAKNIQGLIYPPRCLLCGRAGFEGRDLCAACARELPRQVNACVRCGAALTASGSECGDCIQSPPAINYSRIPYRYQAPLDHLIMAFKFQRQLAMAPLLAGLMLEANTPWTTTPDCLLPVPLHPSRLRERGFNQAHELAKLLSRHSGIPNWQHLASRQRNTATQSLLNAKARRHNMRDAFVIHGQPPPYVVLVDDVVTTGSTVNELARCLRDAGAQRIDVWACARA